MSAPATIAEIATTFNALSYREITNHNWGTCGWECPAVWAVNGETYINGVLLTIDLDYIMGYLLETVDRTIDRVRYATIVRYHGRRPDGTIDHTIEEFDGSHTFFDRTFDRTVPAKWAVDTIYRMVADHHRIQP